MYDFFNTSNGFAFDCSGICYRNNSMVGKLDENNIIDNNNVGNSVFCRLRSWAKHCIRLFEHWLYAR